MPIVPSWEMRIGVCSPTLSTCFASAKNASSRSLAPRAVGAGRVLPDDVDLLAGVAVELPLGQVAGGLRLGARGCRSRR